MPSSPKTSRYAQVADDLRSEITSGRQPPGSPLPSEERLATRHGVSRVTMRSALAVLRAEGLITTVKGGSTYVRDRRVLRLTVSRYSSTFNAGLPASFQAAAHESGLLGSVRVVRLEHLQADAPTAAKLEISQGDPIIVRVRHMSLGDVDPEVVQESTSTIPLDLVKDSPLARPERIPTGVYAAFAALGHAPATMTEEVSTRLPTPDERVTLGLPPGMPVLVFERITRDATRRPLELVHVVATGDRTTLVYDDLPITTR
ncbi:MAG: GntR family transcriptional regulator [Pseudonocardiaceae bacterium]